MCLNLGLNKGIRMQEAHPLVRKAAPKGALLPWVVCGLAAVFYCYEYLLRVSPSVMTEDIMNSFGLSATAFGNLIAFYYYAYTPAQLPVGVLMDRYGPRFILTFAVLACALGTILFGGTQVFWIAALGRFLIGFGSAFAFVGVLKLATAWLPPNRFAFVSGMATTLGMVGAMFGGVGLAGLVKNLGWQDTIVYSGLFGFVLTPIIWLVVRDTPYYREEKNHEYHRSIGFLLLMKQVAAIMMNRQMWLNGLIGCLLYLPTSVFAELWGIPYLSAVYHFPREQAAMLISAVFLGWAFGGPVMGLISDKIHSRRIPLLVGEVIALALIATLLFMPNLSSQVIFSLLLALGVVSSAEVVCFAVGRENCAEHLSGTAVAVTNCLIMLGGMFFQPIVGKLLDLSWDGTLESGVRVYSIEAYQTALVVLPVGLLISIVLTCFLKETHCRPVVS